MGELTEAQRGPEALSRVWWEAWMRFGWNVLELQGHPAWPGGHAQQGRDNSVGSNSRWLWHPVWNWGRLCPNTRWPPQAPSLLSQFQELQERPSEAKVTNAIFDDQKLRNVANVGPWWDQKLPWKLAPPAWLGLGELSPPTASVSLSTQDHTWVGRPYRLLPLLNVPGK